MEQAIKIAIKGGYKMLGFVEQPLFSWAIDRYWGGWLVWVRFGKFGQTSIDKTKNVVDGYNDFDVSKILLDPLFWQALGKAEGWRQGKNQGNMDNHYNFEGWLFKWHRFIDHIAHGKSIDSFFEELLAKDN